MTYTRLACVRAREALDCFPRRLFGVLPLASDTVLMVRPETTIMLRFI